MAFDKGTNPAAKDLTKHALDFFDEALDEAQEKGQSQRKTPRTSISSIGHFKRHTSVAADVLFDEMDANGDGMISKKELTKFMMEKRPSTTVKEIDAVFQSMDLTNNNGVNRWEFKQFRDRLDKQLSEEVPKDSIIMTILSDQNVVGTLITSFATFLWIVQIGVRWWIEKPDPSWSDTLFRVTELVVYSMLLVASFMFLKVEIEPYMKEDRVSRRLRALRYIWTERTRVEKMIKMELEMEDENKLISQAQSRRATVVDAGPKLSVSLESSKSEYSIKIESPNSLNC